jgi:hypothetical protein
MVGAVLSLVKVTVCDAVPVLLHASVAVHVFVTDTVQLLLLRVVLFL